MVRWVLRRLEVYLWLGRFPVDTALYVSAGWFLGGGRVDAKLLALVVALFVGTAGANAVNDWLDRSKDAVTAPHLPIPAGLVTSNEALVFSLLSMGGALALAGMASGSVWRAAAIVASAATTGAFFVLYSTVKGAGLIASVLISVQFSYPAVVGWVAAGFHHGAQFAILFGALTLQGIRGNVFAGLRDYDTDPAVGNTTFAVRLGLARSVWTALLLAVGAGALLVWLALVRDHEIVAGALALLSVASLAAGPRLVRMFREDTERTRASRSRQLHWLAFACSPVTFAFPVAVQPLAGLVIGAVVRVAVGGLTKLYDERLVRGGLRRAAMGDARAAAVITSRTKM